ncbi:MAG: N-acetyltransferase [Tannerella sp.]|nr:N-acetyltransferase [Tannerella sp.]
MEIIHDPNRKIFSTIINGYTGYVSYQIKNGKLNILHTIVPPQIGGQGVASQLVKATYDYAIDNHLKPVATCSYAAIWLQRHPEYRDQ